MGTVISLIGNGPPTVGIGCINNLYVSVENLDATFFRDKTFKEMLLHPQNLAAKFLFMNYPQDGRVFLNGTASFIVSDKLQVMAASTAASVSLLTEHGVKDASAIEEKTFDMGVNEVLKLLKCSLVSKTLLTDTLLQDKRVSESKEDFKGGLIRPKKEEYESMRIKGGLIRPKNKEYESIGIQKVGVRLVLGKSKNMLCYAEASDDFVDLVFSLLTIPLGCFVKEGLVLDSSIGCISNLYDSVQQLDSDKYLRSNEHREILLSPKIAPGFGIANQLLRLEEAVSFQHYRDPHNGFPDSSFLSLLLDVVDPKSPYKKSAHSGGFVRRPGMFKVADNLIITPVSPVSGLSVLTELKVPFSDVEERVVLVGYEEAARLMIASMLSESALSDTFNIPKQPKNATSFVG